MMETEARNRKSMTAEEKVRPKQKTDSQYHLLLAEWVFGFDLQLLYILISDLRAFSGAPAFIGC